MRLAGRIREVTLVPIPGVNEADLVAKIGANVVNGLRKGLQPSPWPDTRDSLMELLSILEQWNYRAQLTAMYADALFRIRQSAKTNSLIETTSIFGDFGEANISRAYVYEMMGDSRRILKGRVPPLARLSGYRRRQAERRGLRTILLAYCPDLLRRFEEVTTARVNWVEEHRKEFEHWFDGSRSDEEIEHLIRQMAATQADLHNVTEQVRSFITSNFPVTKDASPE